LSEDISLIPVADSNKDKKHRKNDEIPGNEKPDSQLAGNSGFARYSLVDSLISGSGEVLAQGLAPSVRRLSGVRLL